MSPFDSWQFWNPHLRGPICYNPAAVRSILPITIRRTELVPTGAAADSASWGADVTGSPVLLNPQFLAGHRLEVPLQQPLREAAKTVRFWS